MIDKIHIDNVEDAQDILKSADTEQLFKKSKSSKDKPWMISLQSIFNELSGWQDEDWKDPLMGDTLVVKVSKAIETYNITKAQFNQIAERNPDYDLGDIWKEAVELREEKIKKAEETELNRVYDEFGFEKAKHKDGDMHPNGKWVWVSSAAGGKGDWRVKGGRTHAANQNNQTTTTSPKSKDSIQTAADRLKLQQEYSTLNNLIKKPSSKKYVDDIRKRMDEIRALGYQGDGKWKDGKTVSTLTGKPEFASTGEVISGKQQSNTSQSTQGNRSRAVAEAKKSGKATPSLLGRVMDNGTPKEVAEIQSVITQMIDGTTDMTMIDKTISQVKADRKRGNTNYVKASDWTLDVLNKRKKFLQSAVGKFETEVVQRMKDSGIKLPMINRDSRGLKKRKDFWLDIETKGMSDIEIAKIERVCNQQGWKFQTGSGHSHVIMPGDNPSGSESKSTPNFRKNK